VGATDLEELTNEGGVSQDIARIVPLQFIPEIFRPPKFPLVFVTQDRWVGIILPGDSLLKCGQCVDGDDGVARDHSILAMLI